jgi:hypothetical protein
MTLFRLMMSWGGDTFPTRCNFFRLRTSHHSIPPAPIAHKKLTAIINPVVHPGRSNRFKHHIVNASYTKSASTNNPPPQYLVGGGGSYRNLPDAVHEEQDYNPIHQSPFGHSIDIPSRMNL